MDDWVKWEMYFHIVWTTEARQPLIEPYMEADLSVAINTKSAEMGASMLAVNAMPDHIHLIASIPPDISVDDFVQRLKDYTAQLMGHEYEMPFTWQGGYGTVTLDKTDLEQAVEYVANQKEHHRARTTIFELERVSDEDEGPGSSHPN